MCACWRRVAGVSGDWLAKKNSALAGGVFAMARANRRDVLILGLHKSGTVRARRCRFLAFDNRSIHHGKLGVHGEVTTRGAISDNSSRLVSA
jgi:hypothetical protein